MSLNDPQWGNGGKNSGNDTGKNDQDKNNTPENKPKEPPKQQGNQQNPPDLEEVWRDFNRRLSGMFDKNPGNKNAHNGNNNNPRGNFNAPQKELNPKLLSGGLILAFGVILLIWLASGFYIVNAQERGVVLQFGRYKETTTPGLRWRLPYPVESHEIVDFSSLRAVQIGYQGSENNSQSVAREALMLTDDENIIDIQFAVQYTLNDAQKFVFKNRNAEASVKQAAETAIREIVGKSKINYVLYEGRADVAAKAATLIQSILDRYETGIFISNVTMQNTQPPKEVQAAFDDAVKANQDKERQKNEGQAYANNVIPKAEGTAARILAEAETYKQTLIATAEGDASRFRQLYAEYAKAPEVTRNRLYLETMQQIYANSSKVLVDTKGQNIIYLPLDKMPQAGANTNANVNSDPAPVLLPVPSNTPNRGTRDANSFGRNR